MTAPIRWGILATGKIAHKFAQGLAELPDAHLQAVASRNIERAQEFAQTYGAPTAHGSYEALANDPEVDVVYIASPHPYHHPHTLLCLDGGKHVLCEKPLALNEQQVKEMTARAAHKGLFLMEALWTRFLPVWREAERWIQAGKIGEVRMLMANFCFRSDTFDVADRKFNRALGGSAMLDIGIYPIAMAYYVFGQEPIHVQSTATLGTTGTDEQSSYLFRYENGAQAVLSCSFHTHGPKDAVICGTKANLRIPLFWRGQQLIVERHMEPSEVYDFSYAATGLQHQAQAIMEDIRAGRQQNTRMPWSESLRIARMMDRLRSDWGIVFPQEREQ